MVDLGRVLASKLAPHFKKNQKMGIPRGFEGTLLSGRFRFGVMQMAATTMMLADSDSDSDDDMVIQFGGRVKQSRPTK